LNARALVATVVVVLVFATPAPASAASPYDDPFFLNWPAFLPAVPVDVTASTETDCPSGGVACVDNVVRVMQERLQALGCSHGSSFAYVYLRTTQEYRRAVEDPRFFADNAFVNHEDTVFADFYFRAQDRWRAGAVADVPPAWRIAFRAADRREVTGMGDALLGMNAHISRDLPFVLNAIGTVDADGVSRKPDHDRVNAVLNAVTAYVLQEAAARYDPTMDDGNVTFTSIDERALLILVQGWRELAWRNAELLRAAPNLAEKLNVARLIEDQAAIQALALRTAYSYGVLRTSASRDAFCAAHQGS
jgi:Family of unknown function (DUF5995)